MIQEVTTGKGPVLLVAVPEGVKTVCGDLSLGKLVGDYLTDHTLMPYIIDLPTGEWELLGLYPGLTEEQAARVVGTMELAGKIGFFDYGSLPDITFPFSTALESFATLMQRERRYTVNPYGEKPKYKGRWVEKEGIDNTYNEFQLSKKFKQWKEAEARTSACWAVLIKTNK